MARLSTRTAVSIVAAAAVGFGACSTGGDDPPDPPDRGDQAARSDGSVPQPVGPTFVNGGVPQGWRRDSEGARAAAMSAVALTGEVARSGFITRGDMIDQFASNRFSTDLAETTDRQLAELSEALGESPVIPPLLTWTEVPLTAQLIDGDTEGAQVDVWSVLVIATPEADVPRQAWRTVTVDLVWEDSDWKVDGWDSRLGPTPALTPTAAIASTQEVIEVTDWPPATPGLGERD